jgi:acetyltransferase
MELFVHPRSVAVIGASADRRKVGYSMQANARASLGDSCYLVNPAYKEIEGLPCYPSVEDLPVVVDLAIVFVRAPLVPEVLSACGRKGIKRVMIQSAGFAETGEQGRSLQDQCLAIAREYGVRVWGPNCMGVVNGQAKMALSFMRPTLWQKNLRPGGVSLIVQSGMLSAGFLMQILSENYFGVNLACSIGNRSDVNECDLLEYMADDPFTEVVAMYLESIADVERFRNAVKRLNRPVLLVKGGTSDQGAKAALSHTASMAGNARISEGLFRQLGILRADDFVELMDLTKAQVLWRKKTAGTRVAIATFSGAAGIVATDHVMAKEMTLAELSPQTVEQLKTIYPDWMEPGNPLDLWPAIEQNGVTRVYSAVSDALLSDPGVDAIHVHVFVDASLLKRDLDFLHVLGKASKAVAFWIIGDTTCFRPFRDRVESLGIPVYTEIERGIGCLKAATESRKGHSRC